MKRPRVQPLLLTGCALLGAGCLVEFGLRWEGMYRLLRVWLRTLAGEKVGFVKALGYLGSDALAFLAPAYALICALFGIVGVFSCLIWRRHPGLAVTSVVLMGLGCIPGRLLWTGGLEIIRYALLLVILVCSLLSLGRKEKAKRGKGDADSHFGDAPDRHLPARAFRTEGTDAEAPPDCK